MGALRVAWRKRLAFIWYQHLAGGAAVSAFFLRGFRAHIKFPIRAPRNNLGMIRATLSINEVRGLPGVRPSWVPNLHAVVRGCQRGQRGVPPWVDNHAQR